MVFLVKDEMAQVERFFPPSLSPAGPERATCSGRAHESCTSRTYRDSGLLLTQGRGG